MRPSRPWFRTSKNAWYARVNGSQRSLGEHPHGCPAPKKSPKTGLWNAPEPIRNALDAILKGEPKPTAVPAVLTVAILFDRFLQFAEAHNTVKDFKTYKKFLQDLCDFTPPRRSNLGGGSVGTRLAANVTPALVTAWLDARPTWNGSRRHAVISVKRAYNWAAAERQVPSNLLKGLRNTKAASRARFLSPDQRAKVLAMIPDWQFRFFVEAMQESGCRPSEIRRVEAKDVNLDLGIWRLEQHKTVKRTGKPRVVYLTPRLLEITRELVAKYPEGALFRGPRSDRPYGIQGVCARFRRLRIRLKKKHPGIDFKAVCAYAYRHSAASEALKNGVTTAQTAILLGTSSAMIEHHYSHVADDVAYMREVAKKATG